MIEMYFIEQENVGAISFSASEKRVSERAKTMPDNVYTIKSICIKDSEFKKLGTLTYMSKWVYFNKLLKQIA